ncbi:hypothetical protein EV174_007105, partial [Coemansia sp. RSA 2320]
MGRGKYTEQEALDAQPEPTLERPVVRVLGPRGQHLHEVVVASSLVSDEISRRHSSSGQAWFTTLVQLPPKFRSVVWVKRGRYVLADLANPLSDKIGGEITMVLMAAQEKHLMQNNQWPAQYDDIWEMASGQDPSTAGSSRSAAGDGADASSSSSDDAGGSDMDELLGGGNPNR